MTFIASTLTTEGIVLTADSKELISGGQLLWKDFDDILLLKKEDEDSENFSISPKEIKEKFIANSKITNSRVMSIDSAQKLFKITDHTAILIAGKANPGEQEFETSIKEIIELIDKSGEMTFDNSLKITFEYIESLFAKDNEEKYESENIFCGYDSVSESFKVIRFFFADKLVMENGTAKKDKDGRTIKTKIFSKSESKSILQTGGWTKCINELGEFNITNPSINLRQGFLLLNRIMNLAVTIEEITQKITGIGGKIYYAIITKKGFAWVDSEADIMNATK